jgi:hypothetical protein
MDEREFSRLSLEHRSGKNSINTRTRISFFVTREFRV